MSSKAEEISPEDRIEILKRYGQITPPVRRSSIKKPRVGVKGKPPDNPPAIPIPLPPPQDITKQSVSFKSQDTGPAQKIHPSYHPVVPPVEPLKRKLPVTSKVSKTSRLSDTDKQRFEAAREKRKPYKTITDNALIDSEAFKAVPDRAVKVLFLFQQKLIRRKDKSKRDKKWRLVDLPLSFTYNEALWRGLYRQRFSRCLKDLHAYGFIDVEHRGSALRGDYTTFKMSDRWRDFGTSAFKVIPYPKSISWRNFGFGSKIVKSSLKKGKRDLHTGKIK